MSVLRVVVASALLVHGAAAVADFRSGQIDLGPCRDFAIEGARCGTLTVPENRTGPSERFIGIHVLVLPAVGPEIAADPVFFFYGGPGAAASKEVLRSIGFWRGLRARRNLVFVDQRGTGRSAPLHCPFAGDPKDPQTYAIDLFDVAYLTACRERHSRSHDLMRYGTADAIADFEAVRAALGYATINAIGESYGTRVVQEYARRHPERIRSALLLGVVPPSASITEGMAASLDATLDQLFASCESDRTCAAAFPGLRGRTAALLQSARSAGLTAGIGIGEDNPREATISYDLAIAWVRSRLYSVVEAARLPRILSRAANGDVSELVGGAIRWRQAISGALAEGMFASVACSEDMPFVDVAAEVAAARQTWLGSHRVTSQQAACAIWPRAAVAGGFKSPLDVETPILIINGDRDPATGLEWARIAASGARAARLVVARNRSHELTGDPCLSALARQFIDAADPFSVDDACAASLALPPFEVVAGADPVIGGRGERCGAAGGVHARGQTSSNAWFLNDEPGRPGKGSSVDEAELDQCHSRRAKTRECQAPAREY